MRPRYLYLLLPLVGIVATLIAAYQGRSTPLWPGSRYTTADRDRAVRRGLFFIYTVASDPKTFGQWGSDLIWAFYNIQSTTADRELSDLAWRMGHERAREWRRLYPKVPADANADEVAELANGSYTAELLGVPDPAMREALRKATTRFTAADYLFFDPAREAPPEDIPELCSKCGHQNDRGAQTCSRCGTKLKMRTRYGLLTDALIATFGGDGYGVSVGGPYKNALRWLPALRPYPSRGSVPDRIYYDAVYCVTHVVYTYNSYNQKRLSPACFPQEYAYLKDNLIQSIRDRDAETLGEYMDTLQAFGMTFSDPLLEQGADYLLSSQNPDGSWGDPREPDIYGRYHTTWTSLGGLQSFRWTEVLPCPQ
ncbi:MAG TPA: zinc-ribbon domain-containing protein [Bryobacteraceae bacterium]|nr:zinc-ribbon domain-containing protein [Bryobacteraceae bacterium]HUI81092.1 zinc-ribbon domain-containing protein [Bryobacteraceae bacterium]